MDSLSFEIREQLKSLLQNNHPQIKFTFVLTNTNNITKFLKKSLRCNSDMCFNIVYLFICSCCQVQYMDSTSRWLQHCILEHKEWSFRTPSAAQIIFLNNKRVLPTSLTSFL